MQHVFLPTGANNPDRVSRDNSIEESEESTDLSVLISLHPVKIFILRY